MTEELCWCGSGKAYCDCHQKNDDKVRLLQSKGEEVPDPEMLKTKEQIEGIRKAGSYSLGPRLMGFSSEGLMKYAFYFRTNTAADGYIS